MDRRRVLAVGCLLVLAVLAGCSAAGHLDMEPAADDSTLAERTSRTPPALDDASDRGDRIVWRAIANGTATAQSRAPLVEPGLPFAHEGRYYNVSWTVVSSQPGTSVRVGIDYNGSAPNATTVAFETLSTRDRELLAEVLPPKTAPHRQGPDFYADATYDETQRSRSVLLANDTHAVRYEGETYPVTIADTDPVTVRTYRYAATVVADSSSAYASHLRSQYLFTLSGLSDDERAVVDEAVNDTYYAEDDDDASFRSVLETFHRHEAIQRTEYEGLWLVRYDGDVYLADLYYERFDVE